MIKGIPMSEGYAIAKALKLVEPSIDYTPKTIDDVEHEIKKLKVAIDRTKSQLERLKKEAEKKFGAETALIFDAHMMIAEDPEVTEQVIELMKNGKYNLNYAMKTVVDGFVDIFNQLDDEYLRARALDLKDVSLRIIKNALGMHIVDLSTINEEVILIAEDLTPSQTAQIDPKYIHGFITEVGGKTSHSAIIARLLGIPAIAGVKDALKTIDHHQEIIIDGHDGIVLLNPTEQEKQTYQKKIQTLLEEKKSLEAFLGQPTQTSDGYSVELACNIASSKDLKYVLDYDGEGVGLFRTEFLYLDKATLPSEDEQFQEYKQVLETLHPKPVVIRTLDIGGDKQLPALNLAKEDNPFLGVRAIRLCFEHPKLFKTQIRALLRASVYGNLKIMFPMIATKDEFLRAKQIVEDVKKEFDNENTAYGTYELGIMIEIPSAALSAEILAKEVDFFSIGTNDLIQYTFAADRMNESLSYLYQPVHPSILRLIQMVTDAANKAGKWVGVCGEMASNLYAGPLLVGLGVKELSMTPSMILKMRKTFSHLSFKDLQQIASNVLELESEEEILLQLKEIIHI